MPRIYNAEYYYDRLRTVVRLAQPLNEGQFGGPADYKILGV